MIVCMHEDRADHLIGLKLTVLSLLHHCPNLSVIVSSPLPPTNFKAWIEALPNVHLLDDPNLANLKWNIKPTLLLHCLERGYCDVLWIDTDIIINRDFRQYFSRLDNKTLVVTQEYYWGPQQGGTHRASTWGLKPGISLAATANTGIIRVTPNHIELLKAWQLLLKHPAYILAQTKPTEDRPLAMVGDQEVLTALLCSKNFSYISIEMLKRGTEILQCYGAAGYTPAERFKSLFSDAPFFIHAMGHKPWKRFSHLSPTAGETAKTLTQRLRSYHNYLHQELSPYLVVACQYREQLGEPTEWMNVQSIPARLLKAVFWNHFALQEFPLAFVEAIARRFRRIMSADRKFSSGVGVESYPLDT